MADSPAPRHMLTLQSLQNTFTSIVLFIPSKVREEDRAGMALSIWRISKPTPKMFRDLTKVPGLVLGLVSAGSSPRPFPSALRGFSMVPSGLWSPCL